MDIKKIYNEICRIASKYDDIKKIILFGSRARGDNTRTSDIDLAVYPSKVDFERETKFWMDIEDIDTLLQFDIVIIDKDADKEFLDNINKEGVLIYEQMQTKIWE